MIKHIKIEEDDIEQIWYNAKEVCSDDNKIQNLILSGRFSITQLDNPWVKDNMEKAELWQATKRPEGLRINHGEYLNKYHQPAIDYLIEELKNKRDSNRACWSLIDMETLIDSGDNPIPSFLILQAGISNDSKELSLTCYYRALEVNHFLPINVAEICFVAKKINSEVSYSFEKFSIVIHAFNAYSKSNFSCLEIAKIDLLEEGQIGVEVGRIGGAKRWIKEMLENKKDHLESNIAEKGVNSLIKAIRYCTSKLTGEQEGFYSDNFIASLNEVEKAIQKHNNIVSKSTYTQEANIAYDDVKNKITDAINKLN